MKYELLDILSHSIKPYDKAEMCMHRSYQYEEVEDGTSTLSIRLPQTDRMRIRQGRNCVVRSAKIGDKFNFCNEGCTQSIKLELLSKSTKPDDEGMVGLIFAVR